ncbi:MAG: DUF5723 family protein [Bacteroidota bacterium]
MKKILAFSFIIFFSYAVIAQKELSSFSATGSGVATAFLSDYQCLGINPANLGWQRNKAPLHFSLAEVGASVYSDALRKKEIKHDFIFGGKTHFTTQEKIDAAEAFAGNKFTANADVAWLSVAFQKPKFGGLAFSVREHTAFSSVFNKDFAEIVFEGYHASYFDSLVVNGTDTTGYASLPKTIGELADGSKVTGSWYREYVIGYGRKIFETEKFSIYVGADVKYLGGYGIFDLAAENGKLTGFSALSPVLDVNYDFSSPSQLSGDAMKTVGSGFGFDFGATITLFKNLNISAAINDIGSIKWNGNVYEANDTLINNVVSQGFYSYSMVDEMKDLVQDSGLFKWSGLESHTVALPSNFRFGMSYQLGELTNIGLDCYVPLNHKTGNFEKAIVSVGANFGLGDFLVLSIGFGTGGNYDFVIPAGITIEMKDRRWEIGVASRDAITFFKKDNPTISAACGFLRFNLGKME